MFYIVMQDSERESRNSIFDFISHIFKTERYEIKAEQLVEPKYEGLPVFITNNKNMARFLEKKRIDHRYFDENGYKSRCKNC